MNIISRLFAVSILLGTSSLQAQSPDPKESVSLRCFFKGEFPGQTVGELDRWLMFGAIVIAKPFDEMIAGEQYDAVTSVIADRHKLLDGLTFTRVQRAEVGFAFLAASPEGLVFSLPIQNVSEDENDSHPAGFGIIDQRTSTSYGELVGHCFTAVRSADEPSTIAFDAIYPLIEETFNDTISRLETSP